MVRRKILESTTLERLAKILGDTEYGLTGTQIGQYLGLCGLNDRNPSLTKWKRLYFSFEDYQYRHQCSNGILKFINTIVNPKYLSDNEKFENWQARINETLSYYGYELTDEGRFREVKAATTISEAQSRANQLLATLQSRNAHKEIFKYCKAELVDKNYFHAVFEASKGLLERIRVLSCVNTDGIPLVQYVFNHPVLVINDYETKQQKDEQKGFEAIMEGIVNMFRNPQAHQPKIEWPMTEQDALEILSLLSYCHRRLDNSKKLVE